MLLRKVWNNIWNCVLFKCIRMGIKNFNNKDFFSKKNKFNAASLGESNRGFAVYRIWIDHCEAGFFALMRFVLDGLYIADISGFTPYVQITNSKYNVKDDLSDNMFTNYYEQTSDLTLESVNTSCCVIDYDLDHRGWLEDKYSKESSLLSGYDFDFDLIKELAAVKKKYLRINAETEQHLKEDYQQVLDGSKTLGIHFRGNAYTVGLKGHPKGLSIADYIPYIDEALAEGFQRIFVATDDDRALKELTDRYKDLVVYYRDTTRSNDGIDVHDHRSYLGRTGKELGYDVLRDMMTLSQCSGFVCGKSQVSFAVLIEKQMRSETFNYYRLIDNGIFAKDSKEVDKYNRSIRRYSC